MSLSKAYNGEQVAIPEKRVRLHSEDIRRDRAVLIYVRLLKGQKPQEIADLFKISPRYVRMIAQRIPPTVKEKIRREFNRGTLSLG